MQIFRFRTPTNTLLYAASALAFGLSVYHTIMNAYHDLAPHQPRHSEMGLDIIFHLFVIASVALPILMVRANRNMARAYREKIEAEKEAQHIALHDPLTGLFNRRFFHSTAEQMTDAGWADSDRVALSVLLIDLDRFKPINDLRGHHAGDELLKGVARRLIEACPQSATVLRLGGDEFAVMLIGDDPENEGSRVARRILAALQTPFTIDDWSTTISCSIGIAEWDEGIRANQLLRHADQAMYRAKQNGRAGFAHYDEALGAALREEAVMEADLRAAIEANEIVPFFQPIYAIADNSLCGFEVLSRWLHAERGFVPPDRFIALAEDMGMIDRLSDQVLDAACQALAGWDTQLGMSFNISPSQFGNTDLAGRIDAILERHGLPGSRLEIEITEKAVVKDFAKARVIIEQLSAMGISISLDDFGTGTSSLATLTQLPFSKIKIDRSFIEDVDKSATKGKIVSGVLALADSLSLAVTAEGIEQPEELKFLRDRQCTLGQGYFFCRPQPASEIPTVLKGQNIVTFTAAG